MLLLYNHETFTSEHASAATKNVKWISSAHTVKNSIRFPGMLEKFDKTCEMKATVEIVKMKKSIWKYWLTLSIKTFNSLYSSSS